MEGNGRKSVKLTNFQIDFVLTMLGSPESKKDPFTTMLERSNEWEQAKVPYWIKRFRDRIISESRSYFESKEELINEYGIKDEKDGVPLIKKHKGTVSLGDPRFFQKERMEEFARKMQEIQNEVVDLGFYPIPVNWDIIPKLSDPEMSVLMLIAEPDDSLEVKEEPKPQQEEEIEIDGF